MKDFFNEITNLNNHVDSETYQQILRNVDDAIMLVEGKINRLYTDFEVKDLEQLYIFYNGFSGNERINQTIQKGLFDFYISRISFLIENRFYYPINLLLDLFFHERDLFEESVEKNILFMKRTAPILLIDEGGTSTINIACASFYIRLLIPVEWYNGENIQFLKDFIRQNPDSPYLMDAEEAMTRMV